MTTQRIAQLKFTDSFGLEKTVQLKQPIFTMGRKPENDLQLLFDSISRQHAVIMYEQGAYWLMDKDSSSGTFVNNERITRHELKHQDQIWLGGAEGCRLQFLLETSAGPKLFSRSAAVPNPAPERAVTVSASEELQKLTRYLEVNQAFRFSLTPDDVLCLTVDAAIELTKAERGFLMLKNDAGDLEFKVARDDKRNRLPGKDFAMSQTVVAQAISSNRSVILNDRPESSVPTGSQSIVALNLRTVVCVPLRRFHMRERMDATTMEKPEVLGVLYLDSHIASGALSKTSLKLLESLAFEASQALENVRLLGEEQEKQRLEREFAMAREVQVALLPTTLHATERYAVAAHSIPCRYVGGDFYDLISLPEGRVALILADVCGKGISAALLAAMAQGVLQDRLCSGASLEQAVTSLNKVIAQKASNRFITLFCAIVDQAGRLTFVNGGHNPPILVRATGQLELLSSDAMVVGAFDFAEYSETQIQLQAGDLVVAFTDGVTEAADAKEEMFGDERLEQLVRSLAPLTVEQIKDRILDEVLTFTRGLPQGDDITLFALKVK